MDTAALNPFEAHYLYICLECKKQGLELVTKPHSSISVSRAQEIREMVWPVERQAEQQSMFGEMAADRTVGSL